MSSASHSLIAPTANPLLERALHDRFARRRVESGNFGELEPLALRLALMHNTLKPRLRDPQLVVVAGDHGLAVEGLASQDGRTGSSDEVRRILDGRAPVAALAASQGMALTVVDAGLAERLPAREGLLVRKIAHGTRNTRLVQAMSIEQAQAALRAGMEIGESLPGNVIACAGLGVGSEVAAALILSRLGALQARDLLLGNSRLDASKHSRLAVLAQTALARHRDASDPMEVLAAFGGFEIAMLSGLMLSAAQQRRLVMVDGIAACTALMVASRIAAAVTDYCLFCRSQRHLGLDAALRLFQSSAMLELNLDATDGCGAAMSWPLVRAASALLTDVVDSDDTVAVPPSDSLLSFSADQAALAEDPLLLRALGGERPASLRRHAAPEHADAADPAVIGQTPGTPGGWHSPFNLGERENVSAASKVDTRREPDAAT